MSGKRGDGGEGRCQASLVSGGKFAAHLFLQRKVLVVVAIHSSSTSHIMFTPARRRCVSALKNHRSAETSIPAFLLPAFQQQSSSFSTSSPCLSKIGSAPLSLPPDVNFHIVEAPVLKKGARVSRTQEGATVHIEGPLGKLSMPIPAYMNIISDEAKRTYSLSILDQEERKQREMWGE
jgi:large subunit ribosomal protein L6